MKKRILIIGILFLSSLGFAAKKEISKCKKIVLEKVDQDKDQKAKYEERKEWIKNRKNELFKLINKTINIYEFPNANIESERDKLKLKVRMYAKDIKSEDYSQDKKFERIQQRFDNLEKYIIDYAARLKERQLMRR